MKSKFVWSSLVIKDIKVVPRPGKADLRFVDLVDPVTYESSGEFMYMPDDRSEMLPPKGTVVDVYTKPSLYQGRATISFASILPAAAAQKSVSA